jgi:ribosomal protein L24E
MGHCEKNNCTLLQRPLAVAWATVKKKQLDFTAAPPCCRTAHCEKNLTLLQRPLAVAWATVKKTT